jgi:glyoxylase-like metal-dependent hydrolase (beta-lactamase superfamily II)
MYEIYGLRYASIGGIPASDVFAQYSIYDVEDRAMQMEFYFWMIRDGSRVVLMDSGWGPEFTADLPPHLELRLERSPVELLARLDVAPEDVDCIILSHLHSDHIGNVSLFRNANFIVGRTEFDFWTGPMAGRHVIAHPSSAEEIETVRRLHDDGRVNLVSGETEVFPGVRLTEVGGHTPGLLIADVATASGSVVLASDSLHYWEELDQDRPFDIFTDLVAMLRGYDLLRELSSREGTSVVSGHDPVEMDRFHRVNEDCLDLASPIA